MDFSENADAALWDRARRDDGDAFGLLFDSHHDRVYRRAPTTTTTWLEQITDEDYDGA